MSKDYTVTQVDPSKIVPLQALLWLGDDTTPYARSVVCNIAPSAKFPTVGEKVTLS